jgi:predicted Zn-dependent protease
VNFATRMKESFDAMSAALFKQLAAGEELVLNFEAEESLFIRFNGNRVRQNTDVEQTYLSLKFMASGRTVDFQQTLTGDDVRDLAVCARALERCRAEAAVLPLDPNQVPISNNGTSRTIYEGRLLAPSSVVAAITSAAAGTDLAGLYCGGTIINANRNSKGQDHWFATETFFVDYSLYDGNRAVKAIYAGTQWSAADWAANLSRSREQLALLGKPLQNVKPGKYRTYLAPGAVSELMSMFGWGALSAGAWKQGSCAFKKLADGEAKLSPLFSFRENYATGLAPRFNSLGEVAAETSALIVAGELKQLLVSSRSAKEYGLIANASPDSEMPRAPEILPGSLQEANVLRELGSGLYISNLHYLNWSDRTSARITGMTRYACFWVEDGKIAGPIKDLRFDESLYDALGANLLAVTSKSEIDPSVQTYGARALGGRVAPGLLIENFTFTL